MGRGADGESGTLVGFYEGEGAGTARGSRLVQTICAKQLISRKEEKQEETQDFAGVVRPPPAPLSQYQPTCSRPSTPRELVSPLCLGSSGSTPPPP